MTGKELIKYLKDNGWRLERVQGSHHIMIKGKNTLSVPVHGNKDIGRGLLHALMKQVKLK
ncbi:MAG TPA: type II toxin-antitoxin system HicA family toxin [Nitrospirae bacterium]|nr:YcfA-like protein [bacterium BMS3Abin09]GBE41807.1 YcfA-like protein [bacterium BMS3Bbin09]HDH34083.1 type II toxin-antitoxin system HicA family toxin [Nitrospirota bacterium]HDN95426.1 type II toxin-antitoxin system HicA family toxin [Nitrospirota bacterium]HDO67575.1 type II toxin-antitoxin system HicA family toxin [Nitrospirota bacterium]